MTLWNGLKKEERNKMKLKDLIQLENCPAWIKADNIRVSGEDIELINGSVTWKYGTWKDGTWKDGTWECGTWKYGTWENGTWKDGTWKDGTWKDGTWKDGTWENGTWRYGTWENGTCATGKCKWRVFYNPTAKIINIGCVSLSVDEWDNWFSGTREFQTKRGTKEFENIYKSFLMAKYAIKIHNEEIK